MNILVLAPMKVEYLNFAKILSENKSLKHTYKLVECGVGKANAAAAVATEAYGKQYDACVVIGYAASGPAFKQGDVVVPSRARYHDTKIAAGLADELIKEYDLDGSDEGIILTGDRFVDRDLAITLTAQYGQNAIFDMEVTAVAQICDDLGLNLIVLKMISDIPQNDHNEATFLEFVESNRDFSSFLSYLELLN